MTSMQKIQDLFNKGLMKSDKLFKEFQNNILLRSNMEAFTKKFQQLYNGSHENV